MEKSFVSNVFEYEKRMSAGLFGNPTYGNFTDKISFIKDCPISAVETVAGDCTAYHDVSLNKWRLTVQLDEKSIWFLSIFVMSDGTFEKYSLDKELAGDSHFEFKNEQAVRKRIYKAGDYRRDFAVVLVDYVKKYGGEELLRKVYPYITAQFHFD